MTIIEAFKEFIDSEDFKNTAKINDSLGAKYRIYKSRYTKIDPKKPDAKVKGALRVGAMVELLIANGYEITANKAVKKKAVKKSA